MKRWALGLGLFVAIGLLMFVVVGRAPSRSTESPPAVAPLAAPVGVTAQPNKLPPPKFVSIPERKPGRATPDPDRRGLGRQFHEQRRDEAWASQMEKRLSPLVKKDIEAVAGKVDDLTFSCKTDRCVVSWRSSSGASDERVMELLKRIYVGQAIGSSIGHPSEFDGMVLKYVREPGEPPETTAASIEQHRTRRLESVRSGRAPGSVYRLIKQEEWPEP